MVTYVGQLLGTSSSMPLPTNTYTQVNLAIAANIKKNVFSKNPFDASCVAVSTYQKNLVCILTGYFEA